MALITFEDLPSTNTPLNAANLNNNFSELNSAIPSIETGSGENGYYIKYSNGVMECWNTITVTANSNSATWTLPQTFLNTTSMCVSIQSRYKAGQGSSADAINCVNTVNVDGISFYNRVNSATPAYDRDVMIRVIGRWK